MRYIKRIHRIFNILVCWVFFFCNTEPQKVLIYCKTRARQWIVKSESIQSYLCNNIVYKCEVIAAARRRETITSQPRTILSLCLPKLPQKMSARLPWRSELKPFSKVLCVFLCVCGSVFGRGGGTLQQNREEWRRRWGLIERHHWQLVDGWQLACICGPSRHISFCAASLHGVCFTVSEQQWGVGKK